jgi:hypothetical protein
MSRHYNAVQNIMDGSKLQQTTVELKQTSVESVEENDSFG